MLSRDLSGRQTFSVTNKRKTVQRRTVVRICTRKNPWSRADRHVVHEPASISARDRDQRGRPRLRFCGNRLDELTGPGPCATGRNARVPDLQSLRPASRSSGRIGSSAGTPAQAAAASPEGRPAGRIAEGNRSGPAARRRRCAAPIRFRRRRKRLRRSRRQSRSHRKPQWFVRWSWGRLSRPTDHRSKCRAAA